VPRRRRGRGKVAREGEGEGVKGCIRCILRSAVFWTRFWVITGSGIMGWRINRRMSCFDLDSGLGWLRHVLVGRVHVTWIVGGAGRLYLKCMSVLVEDKSRTMTGIQNCRAD